MHPCWSFLFSLIMLFSVRGWAQTESQAIEVIYDPAQLIVEDRAGTELLKDILHQVEETKQKHESFFIPIAPSTKEELKSFATLPQKDQELFLAKKQKFLEKISNGVRWMKVPASLHNKILNVVNTHFFAAAATISRANSSGASLRMQVGGGLGLSTYLAERLRKLPAMSWYPKTGGFYLALGFGFAIRRTEALEGQAPRWIFEVFADFDHLKSVKTFVGTIGVDVTLAYVTEDSRVNGRIKNIQAEAMGPLGTLRHSDSHFSFGPGLGVNLPPIIDKAMFYSFEEKRLVILNLDLTPIGQFFQGTFKMFSAGKASRPLCQGVFN